MLLLYKYNNNLNRTFIYVQKEVIKVKTKNAIVLMDMYKYLKCETRQELAHTSAKILRAADIHRNKLRMNRQTSKLSRRGMAHRVPMHRRFTLKSF